jgi:hypothetical protein
MPKVTRIIFEFITTDPWDDHGVTDLQEEIEAIYSGNLNIASVNMIEAEEIDDPNEDFNDDDNE